MLSEIKLKLMAKDWHFETRAIRTQTQKSNQREHSTPLYMTSSFVFDDAEHARALFANEAEGNIYSRYSNPNNTEFISKLADMEGTDTGFATSSGMAAMYLSMISFLRSGDHVIACRSVFGSTHQIITQLFPRWNIEYTYVDINDLAGWEKHIRKNTRLLFLETPSNPGLDIVDLEWAGKFCKAHRLLFVVDNCFATPYLQQPARFGADVITHSATKFIDGQGRVLGGAVLGSSELMEKVEFMVRHTGPALSPFNGWLLSKSLETLHVRMDRHCENALSLAQHLETKKNIAKVKYPFLPSHPQYETAKKQMKKGGGLVTFELSGMAAGKRFLDALNMISFTANLGDTRTIATHPASTTHSKLSQEEREAVGISDGLVRVSVGLEHIDDIIEDIEQALEQI